VDFKDGIAQLNNCCHWSLLQFYGHTLTSY